MLGSDCSFSRVYSASGPVCTMMLILSSWSTTGSGCTSNLESLSSVTSLSCSGITGFSGFLRDHSVVLCERGLIPDGLFTSGDLSTDCVSENSLSILCYRYGFDSICVFFDASSD